MSLSSSLTKKKLKFIICLIIFNIFNLSNSEAPIEEPKLKINKIILVRKNKNSYLTNELINSSVPYCVGEIFKPNKTTLLINNLNNLGKPFSFFNQIQVMGEVLENDLMNLYIITYEKKELVDVNISGNLKIKTKDINEKFKFEDIHAINELDLKKIANDIKMLYRDKDYHLIDINTELKVQDNNKAAALININENKKSLIKRVFFKGNNNISSKRLRSIIFTRENWILGFVNKAGSYRKESLEQDKLIIESYYKSNGYFMARVTNTDVFLDPISKQYFITFEIDEGDIYTIKEVKAPGNEFISEDRLLNAISIKPCDLYSAKELRENIELLRSIWGGYGYVFADIEPIVIPDEKNKTVSITFNSELGDKVFVNRINVKGNSKTKEHVIRRRLTLDEGDLLTTTKMDSSKDHLENLGFFDPTNGVNWKINRINDELADLDLLLNEIKTGRIGVNMGVGGSPTNTQSTTQSFRIGGSIHDINLFGEGILLKSAGEWSKEEWTISFNLVNPWTFGKPIYSEVDFYVTKSSYIDELKNTKEFRERVIGGFLGGGFTTSNYSFIPEMGVMFKAGIENLRQTSKPTADGLPTPQQTATYQNILDKRFQNGTIFEVTNRMVQDTRNHTLHPSRGYVWSIATKLGLGIDSRTDEKNIKRKMNFAKIEFEGSYYTPLIGENKLIFGIHGFFGIVGQLGRKNIIPFRELFHIGGPASVRGFTFGQIGPMFQNDSIGGKKALFINAEIIFPVTRDFGIKAAIFYDGGAGWDTTFADEIKPRRLLKNNRFEFRQAIGFGIRMLRPTPVKIDWGFKLDRKKGESSSELHLSAYRDF